LRGFVLRTEGRLEESQENMKLAVARGLQGGAIQFALFSEYELGHNYFMQGRWTEVIPIVEKYLAETKSKNFKPFGAFKLGYCYYLTGSKEKILPLFTQVEGWVRPHHSYDRYALRRCQKYIREGKFTNFDEHFIAAWVHQEGKIWAASSAALEQALKYTLGDTPTDLNEEKIELEVQTFPPFHQVWENWALFLYLKGCVLRGLKRPAEAERYHTKVFQLEGKITQEAFVIPHACVELAEIGMEKIKEMGGGPPLAQQFEICEQLLKKTCCCASYDFDKPLGHRIGRDLAKLKNMKKT